MLSPKVELQRPICASTAKDRAVLPASVHPASEPRQPRPSGSRQLSPQGGAPRDPTCRAALPKVDKRERVEPGREETAVTQLRPRERRIKNWVGTRRRLPH